MTKILIVDDVPSNVTVLSRMLTHPDYTICGAYSGQEALDIVAIERPDVILLDVSMPEMSGIEVCRRLKSDPQHRLIPIILVTARTLDDEVVEGLNAGADDYIPKPVTQEVLSARLRSALRIKCIYDELAESNEQLRSEIAVRAKAEEKLRHVQKLEVVGQLAGGIAHEFNNLLQTIEGYAAYALEGLSSGDARFQDLQQVLKASSRATGLTRQLLGFSRRQTLEMKRVDLNCVIRDLTKMLCPLIGAHIQVETSLDPKMRTVCADPGELQQALLNLCLNARDAMPSGGTLTLKTGTTTFPNGDEGCDTEPGDYALVHVIDTGCGMSAETMSRIFEPFYTTKGPGKGTGLGLANVYGIVRQHGGSASVKSEINKGSTFTICLPLVDALEENDQQATNVNSPRGAETILLAEDDACVRELARRVLENAGYTVLEARDGQEAFELYQRYRETLDGMLLDAVMPRLSGPDLYLRIRAEDADIKVVFTTGYAPESVVSGLVLSGDIRLLSKPFDAATLLRTMREAFEECESWQTLS